MPRQLTLERARLIVAYLERVEAHYAGAAAGDPAFNDPSPSVHPDEGRPGTPA